MATQQANAQTSQSIEINGLLEMSEEKSNNYEQSDENKFGFLKTLKKSISLILWQWHLDNINDLVQIAVIQLVEKDRICLSSFPFRLETVALLELDQLFDMTCDFIFFDNDTIFSWLTM